MTKNEQFLAEHERRLAVAPTEPILCRVPGCRRRMYPTRVIARHRGGLIVNTGDEMQYVEARRKESGASFVVDFRCDRGHTSTLKQAASRYGVVTDFDHGPCRWEEDDPSAIAEAQLAAIVGVLIADTLDAGLNPEQAARRAMLAVRSAARQACKATLGDDTGLAAEFEIPHAD